jgi:hypothetical protein
MTLVARESLRRRPNRRGIADAVVITLRSGEIHQKPALVVACFPAYAALSQLGGLTNTQARSNT